MKHYHFQTSISTRALCGFILTWMSNLPVAFGVEPPAASTFLNQYCIDCHSGKQPDGGLSLEQLSSDLTLPVNFAKWERIFDRIRTNEMPPASASQPDAATAQTFLEGLSHHLTEVHQAQKGTVLRRLNRNEYENTLNDLFGVHLRLRDRLPEDSRSHEFDNVGESLGISMVQLQRYIECAEDVLEEAIVHSIGPAESNVVRASYADTRGAEQWLNKIWLHRKDGAVVFFKEFGYPSGMLREANTSSDGWYRIRVTGYAYQSEAPLTFGLGATTFARGLEKPTFGYFELPPGEPTTVETLAWIPNRYMIEITTQGLFDRDNEIRKGGVQNYSGPGLAIQSIEVEGPIELEFPSRGHQLIFDGVVRNEVPPRNPRDRERKTYRPQFEIVTDTPEETAAIILQRVASRAMRRAVTRDAIDDYLQLFSQSLNDGTDFERALRTAITAILCSPDFLYFRENEGDLDDFALAARLSYFLTRTLPDETLRAAAEQGTLTTKPNELVRQAERLLTDQNFNRFIEDFTDAWLNLREIEFTNPDSALFPEFDAFLQYSMLQETRSFVKYAIEHNLGIAQWVQADFAMLNNRLAEHYHIDDVAGPEIRRVDLPPGSVRGGLLSQASVLKVTANGNNTSPVVRGVWVMDRILGEPPQPPPPGIPGVEPDVRGATTLRELLAKHRELDSCQSCHRVIDPPGFALECFDPVGMYRERFRSLGDGERVLDLVRGSKVRYKLGPPVDATGELPDGRQFDGFVQFRQILAQEKARLARAWTTKLATFATGREMGFSDRPLIEAIVQQAEESDYGVRDLLLGLITNELFLTK